MCCRTFITLRFPHPVIHLRSGQLCHSPHIPRAIDDKLSIEPIRYSRSSRGDSSTPAGFIARTAPQSFQNVRVFDFFLLRLCSSCHIPQFLNEITLALSPSSSVTRIPPSVPRVPTSVIDELVDAHLNDKTSVCDGCPQPTSSTLVNPDSDEATEDCNEDSVRSLSNISLSTFAFTDSIGNLSRRSLPARSITPSKS